MGPIIVPPGGHSVPSTPPVVTIAPTKTVNGVWRSESRQVSGGLMGGHLVLRSASLRGSEGQQLPGGSVSREHSQGSWSGAGLRTDLGRHPSYGWAQSLPRPLCSACGRPSCPAASQALPSVPACVPVSPSSKDTRARPSDRMAPRSPLHTHPVSRTWSLCEVLGAGTPTKESGGAQNGVCRS